MYYHVWFSPTRRKWLLQGDIEAAARTFFTEEAERKGIKLLEFGTMVHHVHMLIELAEEQDISRAMRLLKGYSARRIFQLFPELHLNAHVEHLWQKSYGFRVVPPEQVPAVIDYIRTQEDRLEKYG